jgi:hypothetical protein
MKDETSKTAHGAVHIGREHWDVPLRMGLLEYLTFVRRMDAQLRRFVIRWSHVAPPAARQFIRDREPNARRREGPQAKSQHQPEELY